MLLRIDVGQIPPGGRDEKWRARLGRIVPYAERNGRADGEGRIRVHVELGVLNAHQARGTGS
jgi:hypothetical protein